MSEIDDRIVSMRFDNEAFERKLSETIKSLDKLRASLDFANSTRGMQDLAHASNSFNMNNMGSAIEGISARFLAMSTVAITVLSNITTHAVEAAGRMLKAFTVAPILDGFREMETNMNSIQTILSNTKSKGSTLDDVNAALEKLNAYSDQTIYNFSQMARNIGTFTAAGIDLDKSVNSIKGIANLAAISGSNAEQASTAMYQLSQALAAGKVSLMDWNSVVNAGMGGEIFKKALFETGKAMKTITDVPVGATFEEWEKKGGTFREQMQKGWITADVLSTTLSSFSGDLDKASLKALGFSETAAQQMIDLGKLGIAAATEVKTFTQLMGTIKESVASGWAKTFQLIVGDFDQAKTLFTSINNAVGGFVGRMSDARNELLKDWRDLGGRDEVILGFKRALHGLGEILTPIKEAFRDIFPPMTAQRLLELTKGFTTLMSVFMVAEGNGELIKRMFKGVFAVFEIGWEIIKGVVSVVRDLFGAFSGTGQGMLEFGANAGDALVKLNEMLVAGGGIRRFFDRLGEVVVKPIIFIKELAKTIVEFFQGFPDGKPQNAVLDRLGNRFESLLNLSDKLRNGFSRISAVLDEVWNHLSTWFSELGDKLANVMQPGDFDAAVDTVNAGLLGGIIIMLKKFLSGGIKLDFSNGLIDKISESFNGLTGALKAMQADLKAKALLKIAAAVGILTASLVALSLINSADLAKALGAMTIAFGQLIGVLVLLDKVSLTHNPLKLNLLATSLILLATAMGLLSIAIKNLSDLSWEELAKGLAGVGVGLVILTTSLRLITKDTAGLISAGVALGVISGALYVLAQAVQAFATMSWEEMAKGLLGVGIGLGALTLAMKFMPTNMLASSVGMLAISTSMVILAQAVKSFSDMSWEEMAKGLIGVGGGLLVIGLAMKTVAVNPITAVGVLVLSSALVVMAEAVKNMGDIKFGSLVKSLAAFAVTLTMIVVAMKAANGSAAGAASILIVSGALFVLAEVMEKLSKLSIGEILASLAAMAGVFIVLGTAGYFLAAVVPALLGLGGAMLLIGAGFAAFGLGAMLVVKAFELLVKGGKTFIQVFLEVTKMVVTALPEMISALLDSIVELADGIISGAGVLIKAFSVVLGHILDTVVENVPKIGRALAAIIDVGLQLITEKFPELLQTGFLVLLEILKGIRDNISEIVSLGIDIVIALATTLTDNANRVVDAAVDLLLGFIRAITDRFSEIVTTGVDMLVAFLNGIRDNLTKVTEAVVDIITTFVTAMANGVTDLVTAGVDAVIAFVKGITDNLIKITKAATELAITFIRELGNNALKFAKAAADVLIDFLNGLAQAIREKAPELRRAGVNIASAIIEGMVGGLDDLAHKVINKAKNVASNVVNAVKGVFISRSPSRVFMQIGRDLNEGLRIGIEDDNRVNRSAANVARYITKTFQESLSQIPGALSDMDEFKPVITPVLDLTKVQVASRALSGMMDVSTISPEVSFRQARLISTTAEEEASPETPAYAGPAEIKFEQNIYAPEALSTNDIYRNTKSQIALAKEELSIS